MNLDTLVKRAKRQSHFFKDTLDKRKKDEEIYETSKNSLPPAFNKRLFSIQGSEGVVVTGAALEVMAKNAKNIGNKSYRLSPSELMIMKCVVEGLKAIHRGIPYVKAVLSHVVTLEHYEPHQYVKKKSNEVATFCYYILEGSVEATYDGSHGQKLQIYEPDLLYTHRAGEYLGLVTYEGEDKDMAPPATIYNQVHTEMLRIVRRDFHHHVQRTIEELDNQKMNFIENGGSMLQYLPYQQKRELMKYMSKEVFPANQIVIKQNQLTDFVYFIASGHCDCVKMVYLPSFEQRVLLNIGHLEIGQFCGEERIINDGPNELTVITKSHTVCCKVHRAAFETGGYLRNHLMKLIRAHKPTYPSIEELQELGMATYSWEMYKRLEATKEESKDVHEDRQRILQSKNLRYDDTNMMLDFLKGEFHDPKDIKQPIGLSNKYRYVFQNAVLSQKMGLDTTENPKFQSHPVRQERAKSRPSTSQLKTYVEETKEVLDSRALFKQFPGHLKQREGMLRVADITRKQKKVEPPQEEMKLVAMEQDEIIVNLNKQIAALADRVAQKRLTKHEEASDDSPFKEEWERAKVQQLVARYRTNVLERKLRRAKYVHAEELKKLRHQHGKEYVRLDIALEMGNENFEDPESNVGTRLPQIKDTDSIAETESSSKKSESARRYSIAAKRHQFVRQLSTRLFKDHTSPALAKYDALRGNQHKEEHNKVLKPSVSFDAKQRGTSGSWNQLRSKHLKITKTMPLIDTVPQLTSK